MFIWVGKDGRYDREDLNKRCWAGDEISAEVQRFLGARKPYFLSRSTRDQI